MKRMMGAVIACVVLALLVLPLPASAQLAKQVTKSVLPGVTTIEYSGQTLVFNTSAYLRVTLRMVSLTDIEMTVKTIEVDTPQEIYGTASLVIEWTNYNDTLYDDEPPYSPWTGVLHTEAGWAEK